MCLVVVSVEKGSLGTRGRDARLTDTPFCSLQRVLRYMWGNEKNKIQELCSLVRAQGLGLFLKAPFLPLVVSLSIIAYLTCPGLQVLSAAQVWVESRVPTHELCGGEGVDVRKDRFAPSRSGIVRAKSVTRCARGTYRSSESCEMCMDFVSVESETRSTSQRLRRRILRGRVVLIRLPISA